MVSTPRAASPGPRRRPSRASDEVQSITSAQEALRVEQSHRTRVYFAQMFIRLACFLGAVFLADGWLRWVLLVGAVVLPYSAVIFANAGRDRVAYDTSPLTPVPLAELPARPTEPEPAGPGVGRVVEHVDDGVRAADAADGSPRPDGGSPRPDGDPAGPGGGAHDAGGNGDGRDR